MGTSINSFLLLTSTVLLGLLITVPNMSPKPVQSSFQAYFARSLLEGIAKTSLKRSSPTPVVPDRTETLLAALPTEAPGPAAVPSTFRQNCTDRTVFSGRARAIPSATDSRGCIRQMYADEDQELEPPSGRARIQSALGAYERGQSQCRETWWKPSAREPGGGDNCCGNVACLDACLAFCGLAAGTGRRWADASEGSGATPRRSRGGLDGRCCHAQESKCDDVGRGGRCARRPRIWRGREVPTGAGSLRSGDMRG